MPICVFDIAPDGTTSVPTDTGLTGPGRYRWWHFDRTDPSFRDWANANLPAIPAEALLQSETRPRCEPFEDGLILNLRGVNLNADGLADQMVAVRIWVAENAIVTVRVRKIFAIDDIRQQAAAGHGPASPMAFVTQMTAGLMSRVQSVVFEAAERADEIEELLEVDEDTLPDDLPSERRKAIRLRRYLGPQRDALVRLAALDTPLIEKGQRARLREQANLATMVFEELDALTGRLAAVSDHHAARAATEQSHNGYVLSIVAAVFLPLGFLTGLFGVNVDGMPGLEHPYAFTILCISLVLLTAAALLILRRIKWI